MLTLILAPAAIALDAATAAVNLGLAVVCLPIEYGPGARVVDAGWSALARRIAA